MDGLTTSEMEVPLRVSQMFEVLISLMVLVHFHDVDGVLPDHNVGKIFELTKNLK